MAKIIIAGNSCTLESAFTTEQLKKIKKYRPDSLILKDADKKPVFMVDLGSNGSVAPMGVVFDGTTHDGQELACLTKMLPQGVVDVKSWVMENIGTAVLKLNKLEATLGAALTEIDTEVGQVEATISVIGGADAE